MRAVAALVVALLGCTLLAGMMATNPTYNRAIRPFVETVPASETGATRAMSAQFTGWETADQLRFTRYGKVVTRDSGGIFLIVELVTEATQASTRLVASWQGASGRIYGETTRVSGVARQLSEQWAQPGLDMRATAIFELPHDEIAGGALLVGLPLDPALDGKLRLMPPEEAPGHSRLRDLDR